MNTTPGSALDEGIRLLQANDFAGAIALLQQAVQQNPMEGRAHGYLGVAYARVGDLNASIYALQESARLQPQDSAAHYNLAVALAQAQQFPQARQALEHALVLDPGNARAQTALQSLPATVPQPAAPTMSPSAVPPLDLSVPASPPQQAYASAPPAYAPISAPLASPNYTSAPSPLAPPPSAPAVMSLNGEPVAALPSNYQTPPLQTGQPAMYPGAYPPPGNPAAPGMGGMQYAPQSRPMSSSVPPSSGTRILRGLGWGALFGQWWTLWVVFWDLIIGGSRHGGTNAVIIIIGTIVLGLFFGFVGSIMGLIIGAIDGMPDTGAIVGVIFGVLLMGAEYLLSGSTMIFVNIIFWALTGRFIGRNIAARVQQSVQA